MKEKMVSVIIPTYKRADYLTRAIDSVLNQTYNNIEIIVVDDNNSNSTDRKNTESIMQKYNENSKIKYIKHSKNMNGSAARNTGVSASKGEYITFLDDDDFFLSNRIYELVNILEKEPEYNAAYTGVVRVINNKILGIYEAEIDNFQEITLMLHSFFRTGSNMFFRKKALEQLGGFDTEFTRHQDLEFMARYLRENKIKPVKSFSVIKDDSSRINVPNIEELLKMKELFLSKFEKDILNQRNTKEIICRIYRDIYNICPKSNILYPYIKDKVLENGKINTKEKIINMIKLSNQKLVILAERIRAYRKINIISRNQLEEINKIIK